MKKILLTLLLGHIVCSAFSQGSWNIGYIEVNSIKSSMVGKLVKLDFKHFDNQEKLKSKSIRYYITPMDSAIIVCDGVDLTAVEKRKVYVDHGSFDDQYLEILDQSILEKRIYDTRLVEVEDDRLKFMITIDTYEKNSSGQDVRIDSKEKMISIDKVSLDGLMIKN